jgi:hypothetical protein
MSPRSTRRPPGVEPSVAVEIGRNASDAVGEAFIEQVRRRGGRVEVDVLLADGSDAMARLDAVEWDWLGVSTGDIVPVHCLLPPGQLSE